VDASATVAAAAEYMRTLWTTASPAQDAGAVAAAAGASAGGIAVSRGGGGGDDRAGAMKLPTTWDVDAIRRYWATRPLAATRRSSALVSKLLTWMSSLLLDVQRGDHVVQRNAPARARALRELIVAQGPAFVKVGQAVAIRPDLLPAAYLTEFATLLDQVHPTSPQLTLCSHAAVGLTRTHPTSAGRAAQ
jgi:aarF domain-containing kinase